MNLSLPIKCLSVNKAWRSGPRYKSKDYVQYEKDLLKLLPKKSIKGEVEIHYTFYIKNYSRTDVSNLIKCLEDVMVRACIIEDDRKVVYLSAQKIKSNVEYVEIEINQYEAI